MKKINELLELLSELELKNVLCSESSLKEDGFSKSDLTKASNWGLIYYDGCHYKITETGYSLLQQHYATNLLKEVNKTIKNFDESSSKLNREMLLHTKEMRNLTQWILGLTIINLLVMLFQIFF